jgi:hypothetical protein
VSDSGAKYVLQAHGPSVLYIYGSEQGAFNITVESHANLIRQGENGTEDDWSARVLLHATINANGELTNEFVTVDIECQ